MDIKIDTQKKYEHKYGLYSILIWHVPWNRKHSKLESNFRDIKTYTYSIYDYKKKTIIKRVYN